MGVNGMKNLLAVAAVTDITLKEAEMLKEFLADPSKFAAAAAPAAAAAAPAAAAAAKAPEPESRRRMTTWDSVSSTRLHTNLDIRLGNSVDMGLLRSPNMFLFSYPWELV